MTEISEKNLKCGVKVSDVRSWKIKFGENKLYEFSSVLTDPKSDEKKTVYAYFHKPTLDDVAAAGRFTELDIIKAGKVLFDCCYLAGDAEFKEDDELKYGAIILLNQMFKAKIIELKNL